MDEVLLQYKVDNSKKQINEEINEEIDAKISKMTNNVVDLEDVVRPSIQELILNEKDPSETD